MNTVQKVISQMGVVDPFKNHKEQLRLQFIYNWQNAERIIQNQNPEMVLRTFFNKGMREVDTAAVVNDLLNFDVGVHIYKTELETVFNKMFGEDLPPLAQGREVELHETGSHIVSVTNKKLQ